MGEYINAKQAGEQLDIDLSEIVKVLSAASENDGKVLYIRRGKIELEDGEMLFHVNYLT